MTMKRIMVVLLLAAMLLSLTGCTAEPETQDEMETQAPATEMTLDNAPAKLYTGVETDKKVISLIFEGFSDLESMEQIISLMGERKIDCVFFLSGVTVSEQPEIVRAIRSAGLSLGNYGMTGQKKMEQNAVSKNLRQFERSQALFTQTCGSAPTLFRCNGSEYTEEVLQAAAAAGLTAGVQPDAYLNHRSFAAESDTQVYVQRLVRGSILSVKLGQELDVSEYGQVVSIQEMRPAIDPEPGISDAVNDIPHSIYENLAASLEWLLDALEYEGYTIVSPERLQREKVDLFDERDLTAAEQAVLDARYTLPLTQAPLSNCSTRSGGMEDLEGSVLVGDSVMAGVEGYVQWYRQTEAQADSEAESTYLNGVSFLTSANLTVESSLMRINETSIHPECNGEKVSIAQGVKALEAKRVYLMLPSVDPRVYSGTQSLANMKLLIYLIQQENPETEICVVSYPPNQTALENARTNAQVFRYNLELYRLCCELDIPFLDAASALRDETGMLAKEYCMDLRTYGTHLNDAGCEVLLRYLMDHIPSD